MTHVNAITSTTRIIAVWLLGREVPGPPASAGWLRARRSVAAQVRVQPEGARPRPSRGRRAGEGRHSGLPGRPPGGGQTAPGVGRRETDARLGSADGKRRQMAGGPNRRGPRASSVCKRNTRYSASALAPRSLCLPRASLTEASTSPPRSAACAERSRCIPRRCCPASCTGTRCTAWRSAASPCQPDTETRRSPRSRCPSTQPR